MVSEMQTHTKKKKEKLKKFYGTTPTIFRGNGKFILDRKLDARARARRLN